MNSKENKFVKKTPKKVQEKTSDKVKNKGKGYLRLAPWLLAFFSVVIYIPTLDFELTELDDSIFTADYESYNQDPSNLIHSFQRGVFTEKNDVYYRPLLLNSFILNEQLNGNDLRGWHWLNLLLHAMAVFVLFKLLEALMTNKELAWVLTLLFAVHPVLVQAVAWIPGRNDSLLAIFVFSFFYFANRFAESSKTKYLIFQWLLLVAALFTKESAVFAIPAAFFICIFYSSRKWFNKPALLMYASWLLGAFLWFWARSQAHLDSGLLQQDNFLAGVIRRIPAYFQYVGKTLLPLNLSVFPEQADGSLLAGLITSIICLGLIVTTIIKKYNRIQKPLTGMIVFTLFLLPVLMVPDKVNNQDFEHRLYVPMLGVLLLLSETLFVFPFITKKVLVTSAIGVGILFLFINVNRQDFFKDPISFWTEAQRNSPKSSYANMMLGARLDETNGQRADSLILRAYKLDSNQKYINYYMGVLMNKKNKKAEAQRHFLKESQSSGYWECYMPLAQYAFEKNDKKSAAYYLEKHLSNKADDAPASNNLLFLYIENKDRARADELSKKMQSLGVEIKPELKKQLESLD